MSLPGFKADDGHLYWRDLELVQEVLAGSEEAWQTLMENYANLVSSVIRRYLFEEDEVAAVQAEVFAILHGGRLEGYRGKSSLAAWIAVIARNITADLLRQRFGRREIPVGLRRLSALHREVFRLYYVEGQTFPAALAELRDHRPDLDEHALLALLQDIHDRLTDKTMRRIAYDLAAPSVGAVSGRLLEYCHHCTWDDEDGPRDPDPLTRLTLKEAEQRALAILDIVAELPADERRILSLRFEMGLRAHEIADREGLPGQRKVYTTLDRILLKLRRRHAELADDEEKSATG
jgi:RNA polymerase sigma factor (sigma-70 family)